MKWKRRARSRSPAPVISDSAPEKAPAKAPETAARSYKRSRPSSKSARLLGNLKDSLTDLQPHAAPRHTLTPGFGFVPSASQPSCCRSSLPTPELVRPDGTELSNTLYKCSSGGTARTEQKTSSEHKRALRRLQTRVNMKLKTWALHSHLLQEFDGDEADNNKQTRLIISEEQRDSAVRKMVESCRNNPKMQAEFLDAVKQLADVGVMQTSGCHLVAQDPFEASQEVVNALDEMIAQPQKNSSATVDLYKAVDILHKEGEAVMQQLRPLEYISMCSLGKRTDGAWEVVFPTSGSQKRVTGKSG